MVLRQKKVDCIKGANRGLSVCIIDNTRYYFDTICLPPRTLTLLFILLGGKTYTIHGQEMR